MKKLLMLLGLSVLLVACGGSEEPVADAGTDAEVEVNEPPVGEDEVNESTEGVTEDPEEAEPTQEELNEQLKAEAVQADFIELNGDDAEENKKVFAEGEVTHIEKEGMLGKFTLTTDEGDGYGMYTISNFTEEGVTEGAKVKVYGVTSGKDDLGFPVINATVIEE